MSEDEYESGEAGERAALFEQVAAGIQQRDRAWLSNEVLRWTAFVWAVISWSVELRSALCSLPPALGRC